MPKRSKPPTSTNVAKKAKKRPKKVPANEEQHETTPEVEEIHESSDDEEGAEEAKEAAINRIKKDLMKRKSPVYAFFNAEPEIQFGENDEPKYLVYSCSHCGEKIRQGLQTGDRGSTGNMRDHVKRCC
ncbi:hypothetical protein FB446DRAFT_795604 [Lentinula raphanica]|nr:hypothetical protein FB446DRAFT_795604 [Lentinula raphanica]